MNRQHEQTSRGAPALNQAVDLGLRAAVFALLWWTLNDGNNSAWVLGLPAVGLAMALSVAVLPPGGWRLNMGGLLRFAVYFLRQSFLSSIDVAARVFRPQMPLHPGLVP